jgi:hypothetical protein
MGVVAVGGGMSGAPKSKCVGCHSAAGKDASHSGHDFVYAQVMGMGAGDAGSDASDGGSDAGDAG